MLGKVAEPEEREPPSWGTNLVEVKDIPQKPTGAIPKMKSALKVKDDDSLIDEFEQSVLEFKRGELSPSPRRRRKGPETPTGKIVTYLMIKKKHCNLR